MNPTIIDIVSNVVVRDYIQHWWQVAMDIVQLNSDGKNRYELRREAEKLILIAIESALKEYDRNNTFDSVEVKLCALWEEISDNFKDCKVNVVWLEFLCELQDISLFLEDEYTRRLNELVDKRVQSSIG